MNSKKKNKINGRTINSTGRIFDFQTIHPVQKIPFCIYKFYSFYKFINSCSTIDRQHTRSMQSNELQ